MPQNPATAYVAKNPSGVSVPLNADANGNLITGTAGGKAYNNAAGTTGAQIKTGAGVFQQFNVNIAGTTTTATLYDGTSTSGTKLATINTAALSTHTYNIAFTTGLFIVATVSAAADITVTYA